MVFSFSALFLWMVLGIEMASRRSNIQNMINKDLKHNLIKFLKKGKGKCNFTLPLSWISSEATPPQTMAPKRPLPMGRASVQYLAGSLKMTFSGGLEVKHWEWEESMELGFQRSDAVGRCTITHSSSPITGKILTRNCKNTS